MNLRLPAHLLLVLVVGLALVSAEDPNNGGFGFNFFGFNILVKILDAGKQIAIAMTNVAAGALSFIGIDIGVDTVGPACSGVISLLKQNIPSEVTEVIGDITCTDCGVTLALTANVKCTPEKEICLPFGDVEHCGTSTVNIKLQGVSMEGIGAVTGDGCFRIVKKEDGMESKMYKEICVKAGVDSLFDAVQGGSGVNMENLQISECVVTVKDEGGDETKDEECICEICDSDGDEPVSAKLGVHVDCSKINLDPTGEYFLPPTDKCVGVGLLDNSGDNTQIPFVPFMMPLENAFN